jgi:hypothetical protein
MSWSLVIIQYEWGGRGVETMRNVADGERRGK